MVETVPPRPLMASSLSVEHDDAVEIEAYSSGLASVSVCIRFRPAQDGRSSKDTGPWQLGNNGVVLDNPERREWGGYTSVLGPESTQAEVYEHVRPVVQNAVEGVSGVIFAYGQTSAGKTHTMSGHREAPGGRALPVRPFAFDNNNFNVQSSRCIQGACRRHNSKGAAGGVQRGIDEARGVGVQSDHVLCRAV